MRGKKRQTDGLAGPYWAEFRRLRHHLCRDIAPVDDRRETLDGVYTLLLEAQASKKPPQSVYGGSFSDFYEALLEALPGAYSREERNKRKILQIGLAGLGFLIVVGICLGILAWSSGWIGVQRQGIGYLTASSRYTLSKQAVKGVFTLDLNLNDPSSNLGKVIYAEDQCTIRLEALRQDGPGAYTAFFMAEGILSTKGGRLVSAVEELRTPTGGRGLHLAGSLQTQVGGTTYAGECSLVSSDEKHGNGFAFSLFGSQSGPTAAKAVNQAGGHVSIQLQGLVEMEWRQN